MIKLLLTVCNIRDDWASNSVANGASAKIQLILISNFVIVFFSFRVSERLHIPIFFFQVAGKREPEQELEAQQWIEQVVGERFPPGVPYEDVLRNGIFLCKLMNKLQPGIISKINVSGGDYKFMDNLSQ